MIEPGEHVSIFGITGSGKSSLTRQIASLFSRQIIFDRMGQWAGGHVVHTFEEFHDCYENLFSENEFTIVIRPQAGTDGDALVTLADQILQLIYRVESHFPTGLAVIFEEVWLYAPLHSMPPFLLECLLTGRHHKISVIGNAQRPANVSKTLVSQSRHVFIGQYFEARDRDYYRQTVGDLPYLASPPPKFHFFWVRLDHEMIVVSTSPH